MSTTRYAPDRGLTGRMVGTWFGLGLLYVALAAVLIWMGVSTVMVLLIAGGVLFAQWWFSDTMALAAMRARVVTPEEAPELHAMVDRLCAMADMPKPRIAVADTEVPNAFATGRSPSRAVVCVTTGIVRRLDATELEGVLSHELSHVAHRDVTVMTVASFAGVVAGLLTRMWLWSGMTRGRDRDQNAALMFLVIMLVSIVVYVVSFLLTRALSRYRELSADRTGALLTGNPSALASALQKVSGDIASIPDGDLRSMESVSAFAFAPALTSKFSLSTLFMTHPPLEKRLEQLAQISAQLGQR
ncbi:MAG TPA: zinc metalloprotease HtpX [Candidatus Nanopelagicales bacterium]|nr:zinc metalloprotease HtpX [Candidatus Nanopelagicales bacterium]